MFSFNIFHTKVEVHYSFFLLLLIVVFSGNYIFAAASVLFSFFHEFAHKRVAVILGYVPEKISYGLFGGVLHLRDGFIQPLDELLIHLSGPLFNIFTAFMLYGIYLNYYYPWLESVILANVILALFNLMPFYPLDGGKITDLYLAMFLGYGRSQKISRLFSLVFSVFLFLLGLYLIQYSLMNVFLCALAVNLYIARKQDNSFIFYKITRNIEEEKDGSPQIMVCKEDTKVIKVIERYKPMQNRMITIVSDKGKYRGQLTENELLEGIYHCGIHASFKKILYYKKNKKREMEHYL
jgi:stage IV sporulation protein FB